METLRYDKSDLQEAVTVLRKGGVIVYPTDTIWGIGCDATNAEAVARIYAIKRRADAKAMLSLIDAPGRLQTYVREIPSAAWDLIDCATRPITIIYPDVRGLAVNLLADDGSAGIRLTNEPFSKALCSALGRAVVSTSANISGQPAPAFFAQISDDILNQADYVVRFRRNDTTPHEPSSIIKLEVNNTFKIIRK